MTLKETALTINLQSQVVKLAKSNMTKLAYSFKNENFKNWNEINKTEYVDVIEDKRLELALVGTNKEVLLDEKGNYKFTKEGIRELKEFDENLLNSEFDFTFYQVKFEDLTTEESEVFYKENEYKEEVDLEMYNALSRFITNLPVYKTYEEFF